ncbi:MAG TPA: hypothetical protein VM534_05195, partial [Thermoanaerobaculia bacterium]|nr:hypothetical protein [Thermoanaerobaculia bacterium]
VSSLMSPAARVDLVYLREVLQSKSLRNSHQRRPQAPVDKGHLSVDESAHQDIIAVADSPRHREDFTTPGMGPPGTRYRLSGDRIDERGNGPVCGLEHDAVLFYETECLTRSHEINLWQTS